MEEVFRFLKENLDREERYLVVGVSGGVDSMVLLNLLYDFLKNSSIQLVCAHVHHNLRKESDEEQRFVRNYCEEKKILFETTKFQYEEKFTEKIGREKRYCFFETILKKYHSHSLFLAHHGDDLIETVLMKIGRGSTLRGASGISLKSKRNGYTIYRPLLFLDKKTIYEYAKKRGIPYQEDISNQDEHYTRNRYRLNVLPFLKEENPNIHKKYLEYNNQLQELLQYVEKDIEMSYNKIVVDKKFDWQIWKEFDPFLQKEVLRRYLAVIYREKLDNLTNKHLQLLFSFLLYSKKNQYIDLPYFRWKKRDTYLEIVESKEVVNYEFVLEKVVNLPNQHTIEVLENAIENSNNITYLNSQELVLPLRVRNFKKGDKMTIKNMQGHKKVGDIFTDEKVLWEDRQNWPVVVDQTGTILWLPGLKKTQFDRKKDGNYDIILKYY